jgi:hypothetical protein
MPIYRVTFQTELLVDCENESEAERIGYDNLEEEVRNGFSDIISVRNITSSDQLRKGERGSLPWRDAKRNRAGEPEKTIAEILGEW